MDSAIATELKDCMEGEFSESLVLETPSQVDPETGAVVMSKNPRASFYQTDIVAITGDIEEGWFITAEGVKYIIKTPQPVGDGLCLVDLKNA
jgi:hypothetical protein